MDYTLQLPSSLSSSPPISSVPASQASVREDSDTLYIEPVNQATGVARAKGTKRGESAEITEIQPPGQPTQDLAHTADFSAGDYPIPITARGESKPAKQAAPFAGNQPKAAPATERKHAGTPGAASSPIEGYEILGVLGRGGMGIVYKARQTKLDRVVALKMVLSGAHASRTDRERFLSEARAVAQLKHPNILQIHDVGERNEQPYFSLEFLEGGTLQDKMEKYALPPREAAQLIETLARGLHYAHQKGILHRDIKPANVLLSADGVPKISDFGLAKRLDREESLNPSDIVVGTPMYMSPEQAVGKADIGPPADIYSLGATLYELIVGRPPFRGSTVLDTLRMVQNVEPVPPRQLQPSVPSDLQTICLKCLHKEPGQRYATAEAFANDLRNYLEGKPIAARPVPVWEKTWKWSRRNPAAALLIAVSIASLLGFAIGGGAFAYQENQRAQKELGLRREADAEKEEATKQRKIADAEKEEAMRQRKIAETERQLAVQRGEEAQENFLSGQKALEGMVQLAKNRMKNERHLETIGKELLENALVFYDGFLTKKPNDQVMRVQIARAQLFAGDLYEKLGRYEEAEKAYRRADTDFNNLIRDFPSQAAQYRHDLAGVYINQATIFQVRNKDADAESAFARAQEILKAGQTPGRQNPVIEFYMAAGCNNRGIYLHQRGERDRSDQAYLQGIELFDRLIRAQPDEPIYQVEMASTRTNRGYLWTIPAPGDIAKAEPLYQQAIQELTAIVKTRPSVPSYRKEYGIAHLDRAILYTNNQRYAEADSDLQSARKIFDDLARSYPGVADYGYLAAMARLNLGTLKSRQMEWQPSIDAYRQAEAMLDKLTADEPGIAAYQHDWALCSSNLAQAIEKHLRAAVKASKTKTGDPEWGMLAREAGRSWDLALERWKTVNAKFPGEVKFAAELVATFARVSEVHKYLAGVLRKINPAEAQAHLEKRVSLSREMLAVQPTERVLKEQTGEALLGLALLRVEQKNHVAAAQAIDEFRKLVEAGSTYYPLAAGALAQCLAVADKTLTGDERTQAVKAYGERAMRMLESALKAGWQDSKFLQGHPLLQPLRERPEYRERFEQWQKASERP